MTGRGCVIGSKVLLAALLLAGCGGSTKRRTVDGSDLVPDADEAEDTLEPTPDSSLPDTVAPDGASTVASLDAGLIEDAAADAEPGGANTPDAEAPADAALVPDAFELPQDAAPLAPDLSPDLGVDLAPDLAPDLPPPPPDAMVCTGACTCPPPGDTLFVDPVVGNDAPGSVMPTGASAPAACRFRTVTHALAVLGAVKKIVVGTGAPPASLSGEAALVIPAGVAVSSEDATATPGRYTLGVGVTLGDGAALAGFTVTAAITCPAGTASLRGVALAGAGAGAGITVGGGNRCALAVDGVTVSNFETGVLINAGDLTGKGLVATGNTQYGLRALSGAEVGTVTLDGGRFDENKVDGMRWERGTLVGTGVQFMKNTLNGITVHGGSVTLHQARVLSNGDLGIDMLDAKVTVDDGSQLNGNGASGIKVEGGTLVVGGAAGALVDMSDNGPLNALYAVNIDAPGPGTSVTITRAVMKRNFGYGIKVLFQTPDGSVTVTDSELAENRLGGIFLREAQSTKGLTPLVVDNVRIHDNGSGGATGYGIFMSGNNGNIASTVRNSLIRDNGDVGVWVDQPAGQTTISALENNEIDGNNRTAGRATGGVWFAAPSTLTAFSGNKIHDNGGDELGFAAAPTGGGAWPLHGAGCGAPNQIYCYGAGKVGIRAPTGVSVDAQGAAWQSAAPAVGVDFAGDVQVGTACSAVVAVCR
jgi:hypothetical protein